MTEARRRMMQAQGIESLSKPKPTEVIRISREEYNLLDYKDEAVIYYIIESDNSITLMKGAN